VKAGAWPPHCCQCWAGGRVEVPDGTEAEVVLVTRVLDLVVLVDTLVLLELLVAGLVELVVAGLVELLVAGLVELLVAGLVELDTLLEDDTTPPPPPPRRIPLNVLPMGPVLMLE